MVGLQEKEMQKAHKEVRMKLKVNDFIVILKSQVSIVSYQKGACYCTNPNLSRIKEH